jgi:ATP-dependent Zn protease
MYKIRNSILLLFFTFNLNAKNSNNINYKNIWKKTKLFTSFPGFFESWNARNKNYAVHEAGHTTIGKILGLNVIKIKLNKNNGGITKYIKINDAEKNIQTLLAGYLAEKIILGKVKTNCYSDLNKTIKEIIKNHNLKYQNIDEIKKILQIQIEQTEQIILKNQNLIINLAEFLLTKKKNSKGNRVLLKNEIDSIYNQLLQTR